MGVGSTVIFQEAKWLKNNKIPRASPTEEDASRIVGQSARVPMIIS